MADLIDLILRSKLAQWTMSVLEGMTPEQTMLFAVGSVGVTLFLILAIRILAVRLHEISWMISTANEVEREGVFRD